MKIKRIINSSEVEIELTKDELFNAYCEQEHEWDVETCDDYFTNGYGEEEWYDTLSSKTKENIVNEAASTMRRYINKYDMTFEYAIGEAFVDTIKHYIKED